MLRGDPSDGLPGVRGIGEKTASSLLAKYGSLEKIVEAALEILQLLAFGQTNRDIAERMVLSPEAVKTHVEHIFQKLGISGRTAAVAEALRRHLVD